MSRKLKAVNTEIETLTQQQASITQDIQTLETELAQSAELDESKYIQFPSLQAAMKAVGLRLGLLEANKAELEREALFTQFEAMTQAQHDYYVEIASIDTQVRDLQQQINELTKKRRTMQGDNQVAANKRIQLSVQLSKDCTPEEKQRLNSIVKRYRVEGYF